MREAPGIAEMHFSTLPLPRVETHLPITSHSSYTSSNSTSSSAMVRPEGTVAAAWRALKTGLGAPKSSVPGAPGSRPLHRTRKPSVLRKLNWGREAGRLQRLSSAGCRPGAGGGAGAWERGRPGPGAARPPAALGAVARGRAAGRADPRGSRGAALSARQPARAARPRPLPLPETGSGAGQLGLQGGPRQDHGGRIVAKGGGGG